MDNNSGLNEKWYEPKTLVVLLLINVGIAFLYTNQFIGFNTSVQLLIAFLITLATFASGQIFKHHIGHAIQVISSIVYSSFITGFGIKIIKYKEITVMRTIFFIIIFLMEIYLHILISDNRDLIIKKYKHIMRRE